MKKRKVRNIIKCIVGAVFLGGLLFILDFLGICDISSILKFHKKENSSDAEDMC